MSSRPSSASAQSTAMRRAKQPIRGPEEHEEEEDNQRSQSSSRRRLHASHSTHSVASDRDRREDRHQREERSQPDAPMHLHELHTSHRSSAADFASASAAASSYVPSISPCTCDEYRSLRCNDKLYSMLHNQIELDQGSVQRQALAQAAAKAEMEKLRELFGTDLPPDPYDPEKETRAAQARFHASDFTLGNLKNQSTRVVVPPTIVYSRTRPTEYYFTSMQTGQLLRKSRAKVTSQRILEDLLAFSKRNVSEALKNLGSSREAERKQHAWEMEKEEYTREVQFGNGKDANIPHYMRARAPMVDGKPMKIEPPKRPPTRPVSVFGGPPKLASSGSAMKLQHPLTSSPSSQPQLHCDILAQFTFASDAPRYNDERLPYTMLVPGAELNPHAFPDILYLNVRSLHHFLNVVNADVNRPRAIGVLQPFVRCAEERNTVYRVSFTALDATDSAFAAPSPSHPPSLSSLPTSFHVSMEARQNVVKLVDRSGVEEKQLRGRGSGQEYLDHQQSTSRAKKVVHEFTAAERAATFDAAHLSMTVEGGKGKRAQHEIEVHRDQSNKQHILYPRLPSSLATPLSPVTSAPSPHSTTLIVPSSYPFSPSALTSAHRLVVPPALQARFQAAILRMVSHVNELYRVSERREQEQRERQIELQRKALESGRIQHAPPLIPLSPSITVGYMEATFKIDRDNNLFLLTCRSLKHLAREPADETTGQPPTTFVRCAQCCRVCERLPDVLAVKEANVRPTSEAILAAERAAASASQLPHPSQNADDVPLYSRARRGGDYEENEAAARQRRLDRLVDPTRRAGGDKSVLVLAMKKKRPGAEEEEGDLEEQMNDPEIWPESHFSPPPVPTDRFHAASDRIQSNPLFDGAVRDDEEEEDGDEEERRGQQREEEPAERSKRISAEQQLNNRLQAAKMLARETELARSAPRQPPPPASSSSAHSLHSSSLHRSKLSRPESATEAKMRAKIAPYLTAEPTGTAREVIAAAVAAKVKKNRPASARPASRANGSGHSSTMSSAANSSTSSRRSLAESNSAAVTHYKQPTTAAEKLALLQSSLSDKDIARIMRGEPIRSEEKAVVSPSSHRVDHVHTSDVRFFNVHFDGSETGSLRREVAKMAALYPQMKKAAPGPRVVDGWTPGRPQRHRDTQAFDADTSIEIEENQE